MRINAISQQLLGLSPKTRIISASALFLALCAFGAFAVAPMAPDASDLPVVSVTQELPLPDVAAQLSADAQQATQTYINEEKVRPGDSLAAVLTRLGVDDDDAVKFIKSNHTAHDVLQLKNNELLQAQTNADGELLWLSTVLVDSRDNPAKNLVISRDSKGFKAVETAANLERRLEMRSGEIKSSLYAAIDAEQIPQSVGDQIAEMFNTDIDFASDLQRGDHFEVVYETFWHNGEFVRAGRVLAGEFTNDGKTYQSIWNDEPGSTGGSYYDRYGHSLKKAFLKSPIAFTRISSGFSMRMHPILGIWKQHKGVDFAAATGTPVHASGDGVIDFEGRQNGYGNMVVIKHWSNYSTAYGHMSRFAAGIHKGSKVSQGDVIGYVGMTGWATGPHLHYEFRINNEARDPMKVNIPSAQPLTASEMLHFKTVSAEMQHRFALLMPQGGKPMQLASN